jgi:hypothetical protein
MIIANPIYDVVFKRLMEDKRIAKFFIGTLMEEEIEDVWLKPQEMTYPAGAEGLALMRLDFIATIKDENGAYKKVLIEIQKAKNALDLMRFRNYLGEQYKKEDEVETATGKVYTPLPIVTIYMLGYTLHGVESPAVKVAREYIDLITHKVITHKTEFIEKLTHDCYVVQLQRIKGKWHTKLEELLSLFEQDNFVDDKKIVKEYNYEVNDPNAKIMLDILHYEGTDPQRKWVIEQEKEYWRTFYASAGEGFRELLDKFEGVKKEKEEVTKEKEEAVKEKEEAVKEKEETQRALEEEKRAKETLERELEELRRMLNK